MRHVYTITDAGLVNLCGAIIEQAVKDYEKALKGQNPYVKNIPAKATIIELEKFFRSDDFEFLVKPVMDIEGEAVIYAVKKRVKEGIKTRHTYVVRDV